MLAGIDRQIVTAVKKCFEPTTTRQDNLQLRIGWGGGIKEKKGSPTENKETKNTHKTPSAAEWTFVQEIAKEITKK